MYSFLHATFIPALSVAVLVYPAIAAGETKYRLFMLTFTKENVDKHHF